MRVPCTWTWRTANGKSAEIAVCCCGLSLLLGRLEEAFTLFLDEAAEGERRATGQALQRGSISRLVRPIPPSGRGRAEGGDMICHDGVHRSARVRFSERQQLVPPGLAHDGLEADWPRELLAQHARDLGVVEQLGACRILDHAGLETLGVQESGKADPGGILAADPGEARVAEAVADRPLVTDGSAVQRRYVLVEKRRDPQADKIQTCPAQHLFGEPVRAAEVARALGVRSSVGHHDDPWVSSDLPGGCREVRGSLHDAAAYRI